MKESLTIYDFVFIGSGMGALAAANILAQEGHSVLILEKNQQLGGSLQTFSRDKRIFDTGVHYIGGLNKDENLYKIFAHLGILQHLELMKLDENCFDQIHFPAGKKYALEQGYENYSKGLLKDFPEEAIAINTYCEKVKEYCSYFPLYNLKLTAKFNYIDHPEVLELDAWDYINSLTNNKDLAGVLLSSGPLYAGEKGITPFYVIALIMNSYILGSYRIKNGGGQLTKALVKELRKYNVSLLKRKKVVKAHYENGLVSCVETDDGERYYGKNFISNMHPTVTIDVFGEDNFKPAYKNRIRKVENTSACFSLYVSLKEKSIPYLNYNIYDYSVPPEQVWSITNYDKETWPQMLFISMQASKNKGQYADGLSVVTYMAYEEVKEWETTFNTVVLKGDRGESYKGFKKDKEAKIIERLETHFPKLKDQIIGVYSSTPLTYKDYIGNYDGSTYGIKKDVSKINASVINSKTKVKNLFLTGQNIVFHGILGATIGALTTCFNFLDNKALIEKINK